MRCLIDGCNYPEGQCSGACDEGRWERAAGHPPAAPPRTLAQRLQQAAEPVVRSERALDQQAERCGKCHITPAEFVRANSMPAIEASVIRAVTMWRIAGGVKHLEEARRALDLLINMERAHV